MGFEINGGVLEKYTDEIGVTNVVVPSNVVKIGEMAFLYRKKIVSVVIPEGVQVIGENAFEGCTNLVSVIFPSSLRSIECEAFLDCSSLRQVVVPENVVVEKNAFDGITSVVRLSSVGGSLLGENKAETSSNSKESSIAEYCNTPTQTYNNLISVLYQIAKKYEKQNVDKEKTNVISSDPDNSSMNMCDNTVIRSHNELISVLHQIANKYEKYGENKALKECLTNEEQESEYIEDYDCIDEDDKLDEEDPYYKDGILPDDAFTIEDGVLTEFDSWNYILCECVRIPYGVVEIGGDAFKMNNSIKQVYIPESVIKIEGGAFWQCKELESVSFPSSIKEIGLSSFTLCPKLLSVVLPDTVYLEYDNVFGGPFDETTEIIKKPINEFRAYIANDNKITKESVEKATFVSNSVDEPHCGSNDYNIHKYMNGVVEFWLDKEKYSITELPVDRSSSTDGKITAFRTDDGIYTFYVATVTHDNQYRAGKKGGMLWKAAVETMVNGFRDGNNEVRYYEIAGDNSILFISYAPEDYSERCERTNNIQAVVTVDDHTMFLVNLTIKAKSENGLALNAIAYNEELSSFDDMIKTYYRELLDFISCIHVYNKKLDLKGTSPELLMKNIDHLTEPEYGRDNVETVVGGIYKHDETISYDMPDNFKAIRKESEDSSSYLKVSYNYNYMPEIGDAESPDKDTGGDGIECVIFAMVHSIGINMDEHPYETQKEVNADLFSYVNPLEKFCDTISQVNSSPDIIMGIAEPNGLLAGHTVSVCIHTDFLRLINMTFHFLPVEDKDDKYSDIYCEFVEKLVKSIRIDGEAISFNGFNAKSIYNEVFGSQHISNELSVAFPDESLFPHYNYILSNERFMSGFAALGGVNVSINSSGTEYEFEPIKNIDSESYELNALYNRISSNDRTFYSLDRTAKEMSRLFRVNATAFDPQDDREAELESRFIKKAYMFSALRSFAWTLASYCDDNSKSPTDVDVEVLSAIVRFISKRNWLNFEDESYCKGLCSTSDIFVYYVPDNTSSYDKNRLVSNQDLDDDDDSGQIPSSVASLDDLRKDLQYIYPAIRKVWEKLKTTRNYNKELDGDEADIVYAWCALARAAREPFYSQDGPMSYYLDQPSNY